MNVEENAKVATNRFDDMQKKVLRSAKSADHVLRQLAKISKQVELLEKNV